MTDTTSPKKNSNPAQLALIAGIAAIMLRFVGGLLWNGFAFQTLTMLILPALALLFVAVKKSVPAIIFGALSAVNGAVVVFRDVWTGNIHYLPIEFVVDLLGLAAAVAVVIFSAQILSARKSANPAMPLQVQSVPQGPSDRKWVTALLLSLFFGILGFDRLYVGRTGLAMAKLFTAGGVGVWALVDFILICVGKMPDVHGRPLQR